MNIKGNITIEGYPLAYSLTLDAPNNCYIDGETMNIYDCSDYGPCGHCEKEVECTDCPCNPYYSN